MTKTLKLKSDMTLLEMQSFSCDIVEMKGWGIATNPDLVMLLAEELGEVAKEVRRLHFGTFDDEDATKEDLSYELIDVINYVLRLANNHGIDLDKAFIEKNEKILKRLA